MPDESVLGGGRYGTDEPGYAALLREAKRWPDRVWAIEGCSGIGRHIAVRLLADGEQVVDVPPKLSARARVFSTGQGRKTDATDATDAQDVGRGCPPSTCAGNQLYRRLGEHRMIDLDAVAGLAREVAAQVHVPLFRRGVVGEEKSPGELVSRVDREAERLLLDGLADLTPGVPVIGEEAASADPSLFGALQRERQVWVADPSTARCSSSTVRRTTRSCSRWWTPAARSPRLCTSPSTGARTRLSWAAAPGGTACGCTGRPQTPTT